jgi:Permuted papain-like amidase enzyme, YaeF/YiiX, C92 family
VTSDSSEPQAPDEFPMPAARFLEHAERYLRRGDIVLCKGKATLFSLAIRWWTNSHFSHTALVFAVPSAEEGFERTFLIEAGTSGVDITDLKHYAIDAARVYDIAIKRLEQPWMTTEVQRSVRGHMLNFIKASYDYVKVMALIRSLWSHVVFGFSVPAVGIDKAVRRSYRLSRVPPSKFLCSGFVQYGFMSALRRLVATGQLPTSALDDAIFNDRIGPRADDAAILATTPQDFAQSDKLAWRYVMRRRHVYRVTSYAEVDRILRRR